MIITSAGGWVWGGARSTPAAPAHTRLLQKNSRHFVPPHVQGVHQIFEGMPDRPWKEGEKRTSRMVFIGRDLDRDLIEEGFRSALVKQPAAAAAEPVAQ